MIKIAGITILGSIISITLKEAGRRDMALLVALSVSIYVLYESATALFEIMEPLSALMSKGSESEILKTSIKITGIAYIAEFSADICKSVGEEALSKKALLFGKIMVLALSLPAIEELFFVISELL